MIISATGIVVDHYGDVLLIQRDDTRTLAPPGGAADIGELPPDTVAREVREETGLKVMAVRLVGLYYLPLRPQNFFALVFRCIMRGGEIKTSEESPRVGFFKTNPLPSPMLDIHAQRIQRSIDHKGGPPYWGTDKLSTRLRLGNLLMNGVIYPWLHFRRKRAGLPAYEPPPSWQANANVILRNSQGEILWTRDRESGIWTLPGGTCIAEEPPWETAVRSLNSTLGMSVHLNGLSGVYPAPGDPQMTFVFSGSNSAKPTLAPALDTGYFAPGQEPKEAVPQHTALAADTSKNGEDVRFRLLDRERSRQ
jgi:8-oxo-dGTP diphosphatase